VRLRASARAEIESLVKAYVDDCAKRTELSPRGCPFSSYSFATVTDVKWAIAQYPTIAVELGRNGTVSVRSQRSGRATVTGKTSGGTTYDGSDTFDIYGTATLTGGRITFQPIR